MNYLASIFIMFFMVATALMLGLPSNQMDEEVFKQYNESFQDNINEEPSGVFDLILDRAISLDTIGGSLALGSLTFALGGSGVIVISMALLGGMIPIALDYLVITNQIIFALPTPITWVLGGGFFLVLVISILRFGAGR